MIAITDVHYRSQSATAARLLARAWTDDAAVSERTATVAAAGDYEPGAFYRRELPALLAVLGAAPADEGIDVIVVDGYAWLGPERPGLGVHLWRALGEAIPIVGVAKSRFAGAAAIEVARGDSARPLYVTAAGLDAAVAAAHVASMHGAHRLPTLLVRADHLARGLP